jgi:hypothetical protein
MKKNGRLASLFALEDGNRTDTLDIARQCARLTTPWILPEDARTEGEKLFRQNQSLGNRGVANLQGKLLLALYPPDYPFFQITLDPEFQYDPSVPAEFKQQIADRLWLQQLQIAATLESATVVSQSRPGAGFRVAQHHSIGQMIVTGDSLEEITDDYKFKVHRRDNYVTRRDGSGNVIYHVTRESIDPMSLSEADLLKAELSPGELREKSAQSRMMNMLTIHEWNYQSRTWVIEQEINGHIIRTSEEPESRVFSTPFQLITGENYGHGFVEGLAADLLSYDTLCAKHLQAVGTMVRMVPVIDPSSSTQESDLTRPSGEPIRSRVSGGQVQDIAFLQTQKNGDLIPVNQRMDKLEANIAKAFLLESAIQPQKERVTAAQIGRIAEEVEGATGGLYIPISEGKHLPLLRRVRWQMKRDGLLPAMPERAEKMVRFKVLTGITALAQQARMGRILTLTQAMAAISPNGLSRIDEGVLARELERASNIHAPGLVKSDERMEQDQQKAIRAQAQVAANEQIAKTAGKVIETAAAGAGV